jgi:hypothetical protein
VANYVVTYTPLVASRSGRDAVQRHNHPPYADASCRREPDLEAVYPSISCVCRGANFAPRLHTGDVVVYLTMKGTYPGRRDPHWRFVAALRVRQLFPSHREAAEWHRAQGLPLPSDCLVPDNPPLPLDHTDGPDDNLAEWDGVYQARVAAHGTLAICDPLWIDLYDPPVLTPAQLFRIFGRIPPTRNPPPILVRELEALMSAAGISPDGSHVRRPKFPVRPRTRSAPLRGVRTGCRSGACGQKSRPITARRTC